MIDDISLDGEFFDSDFFVYREDADVAWRAQLMGWKCLYAPYARGYHVRKVLPGNRRALPPEINMHSVKNRFLMRMKNISPDLYRRNWFSITARDLMVVDVLPAVGAHVRSRRSGFWPRTGSACWPSAAISGSAGAWTTSTWRAGSSTSRSASRRRRRSARVLSRVRRPRKT